MSNAKERAKLRQQFETKRSYVASKFGVKEADIDALLDGVLPYSSIPEICDVEAVYEHLVATGWTPPEKR